MSYDPFGEPEARAPLPPPVARAPIPPPPSTPPTPGDFIGPPMPPTDPRAFLRPPPKPPVPQTAQDLNREEYGRLTGTTWRSVPGEPGGGYWMPPAPPPLTPDRPPGYTWRSVPGEPGGGYWEPPRPHPAPPPHDPDPPLGSWTPDQGADPFDPSRLQHDIDRGVYGPGGMYFPRHGPRYPGDPGVAAAGPPAGGLPFGQAYDGAPDWRKMQPWQLGNANFRNPVLKLISNAEAGGQNIEGRAAVDRRQGSSGYFQISDATWREFCNLANACRWSRAIDAPPQVQAAVAWNIPLGRWTTKQVVKNQYPWATDNMTLGQIAQRGRSTLDADVPGSRAGQPERYIPPREARPPHQWGQPPDMQWSPGHMPMAHDIPNIMMSILPLIFTLFSGHAGFAGTAMLTAFGAYQGARNQRQLLDAKEQKERWKTSLNETVDRLQEEQLAAAGVYAADPEGKDPQTPGKLMEIAAHFDDPQLMAAVQNGDMAAVQRLFQERDKVYQTLAKTSAAQTKADQQAAERGVQTSAETAPYGAAAPGAAAAPDQPQAPAGPFAGWGGGGAGTSAAPAAPPSGAGVSAPPAAAPARPAAAPAAPVTPEGPPDTVVPAAPSEQPPSPGPSPPEGAGAAPRPAADGPPPQYLSPDQLLRTTGLSPERLDQDARQYLESQKPLYNPHTDPLGVQRNEAVARRASQMQSYIENAIRSHRPGDDPEKLFRRIESVDPSMAEIARNIQQGDVPQPTGWQLRTPLFRDALNIAKASDPTWDGTRWVTNYRTKVGFSVGTQSNQVASANRALQHMTILMETANKLGNTPVKGLNAIRNAIRTQLGDDAVTNFEIARTHVAQELIRVFRGTGGSITELQADLKTVTENASPQQIKGYIRTITELLKGQLDAMGDLYSRGTHKPVTSGQLLSPQARTTYNRILGTPLEPLEPGTPDPNRWSTQIEQPHLDETATPPPGSAYGPGPAPVEGLPPGWSESQ